MLNTDKLKTRMKNLGITQAALANELGIKTPTMCQKINNIRPVLLTEAELIAQKLDIKDSEFGDYFFK